MKLSFLSAAIVALSLPLAAHADTLYTSAAAFTAATTALTTVTFDGIAPTDGYVTEGMTFSLGGVHFSSADYINVNGPTYYSSRYASDPVYAYGGYALNVGNSAPSTVTATFAPSTAVGLRLGGLFGPGLVTITLSDGTVYTVTTPDSVARTGMLDFYGFTSSTPISSLTFVIPTSGAFDSVSFGTAAPATPEPSTLLLFGTGLVAACGVVRRRVVRV